MVDRFIERDVCSNDSIGLISELGALNYYTCMWLEHVGARYFHSP